MVYEPTNFLLSLASAIAAEFDAPPAIGEQLWIHAANEAVTAETYASIRITSGPRPEVNTGMPTIPHITVQVMTSGKNNIAVMAFAQQLFNAFYDENEQPRFNWEIEGKKLDDDDVTVIADADTPSYLIHRVSLMQPPALIGVDEYGRNEAPFNVEIRFEPVPAEAL